MQVGEVVGIVITINILLHHAALRYTRTDNRTSSHQCEIIITFQFLQKLAHCRAFDIKAANGVSVSYTCCYLIIFFEFLNLRDVDLLMPVLVDYFYCFPYVTKSTLTKNIKFI